MATFEEQVMDAWDEWEDLTRASASDPDDFITWATTNKKLAARPQDVRRMLRKQVTSVLRSVLRRSPEGFKYRAKQSVLLPDDEGNFHRLWFDTDKAGTPTLRQKSSRQRRDRIANHVYRAVCDNEHMNAVFKDDPQLSFHLDFADDVAEHRAAELKEDGEGDKKAAD
jgi:hypothetical protein